MTAFILQYSFTYHFNDPHWSHNRLNIFTYKNTLAQNMFMCPDFFTHVMSEMWRGLPLTPAVKVETYV